MATITAKIEKGILTLTVPLTPAAKAPLSSTGKNKVVFSSGGFQDVGEGVRVNLTAITKP